MKLSEYKSLISALPVRKQSFTTLRSTWGKFEEIIPWLADHNSNLFGTDETLTLSREDVFASKHAVRDLILKTIYWGYPRNMRGNNFSNILKSIEVLESTLTTIRDKQTLDHTDYQQLESDFGRITGLGLSTYSKLLYFLEVKIDGNDCQILDDRLATIFKNEVFDDFYLLRRNPTMKYPEYLSLMSEIARTLETRSENVEQFLFIFGSHLK